MLVLGGALLVGGALVGSLMGDMVNDGARAKLGDGSDADPVERFELGRDAYNDTPSARAAPRRRVVTAPNEIEEVGSYRNGRRLLAPYEPARQRERAANRRAEEWQDSYFGGGLDTAERQPSVGESAPPADDAPPVRVTGDATTVRALPPVVVSEGAKKPTARPDPMLMNGIEQAPPPRPADEG